MCRKRDATEIQKNQCCKGLATAGMAATKPQALRAVSPTLIQARRAEAIQVLGRARQVLDFVSGMGQAEQHRQTQQLAEAPSPAKALALQLAVSFPSHFQHPRYVQSHKEWGCFACW